MGGSAYGWSLELGASLPAKKEEAHLTSRRFELALGTHFERWGLEGGFFQYRGLGVKKQAQPKGTTADPARLNTDNYFVNALWVPWKRHERTSLESLMNNEFDGPVGSWAPLVALGYSQGSYRADDSLIPEGERERYPVTAPCRQLHYFAANAKAGAVLFYNSTFGLSVSFRMLLGAAASATRLSCDGEDGALNVTYDPAVGMHFAVQQRIESWFWNVTMFAEQQEVATEDAIFSAQLGRAKTTIGRSF